VSQIDLNLSQFVQEKLDEEMGPSSEDLAQAYRENADHAAETNEQWKHASTEADEHLGPHPDEE
jgi:cytochrome c551/c552